jgi:hypothetical protein
MLSTHIGRWILTIIEVYGGSIASSSLTNPAPWLWKVRRRFPRLMTNDAAGKLVTYELRTLDGNAG